MPLSLRGTFIVFPTLLRLNAPDMDAIWMEYGYGMETKKRHKKRASCYKNRRLTSFVL